MSARITVLGGGAWGTALAVQAKRAGHSVSLWGRDVQAMAAIRQGEHPAYLPGIELPSGIAATTDAGEALRGSDCVLAVIPAQALRSALLGLMPFVPVGVPLVLCAKGIERSSGALLSDLVRDIAPDNPLAVLSGPSFAADVARGLPTAVVIAADEEAFASRLAVLLSAGNFRCYSSDDVIGVELGGALKNVFAIAAGAVQGAGLGASAHAAMVTRGFVELRRIATAFGAKQETLMGLSGLGDLVLTSSAAQSRNFRYGLAIGRCDSLEGLPLAEGVETAAIAAKIAAERGIDAPIIAAVSQILDRAITINEAVAALMARPLRSEAE